MAKKAKEKKQNGNTKENVLNLDNEIVIGIKTLPEPQLSKKQKRDLENSKKTDKQNKSMKNTRKIEKNCKKAKKNTVSKKGSQKNAKQNVRKNSKKTGKQKEKLEAGFEELNIEIPNMAIKQKKKSKVTTKEQEKEKKKRKVIFRAIKYTTILAILVGGGIYFMLSPFFNIKEITVIGTEKLKPEELISLSGIQLEENTFQLKGSQIEENIKQNAYIDQVKLKRKLPDKIELQVTERKPSFMLAFANAYVYISNQGYMLEVAQNQIAKPIITGFLTPEEEIHVGNRLCMEDLQRLEHALQIMKSAEANGIGNKVTKINIADKQNYLLEIKEEKKIIHIGDNSNLSTKMLYIISIIEENKKVEGEIFVNTDLSNKGAIFRKKI